jgi:predicted MFS family arabinose efflux permease
MVFNISIAAGALGGALAIDHISSTAPILLGALLGVAATAAAAAVRTGHRA